MARTCSLHFPHVLCCCVFTSHVIIVAVMPAEECGSGFQSPSHFRHTCVWAAGALPVLSARGPCSPSAYGAIVFSPCPSSHIEAEQLMKGTLWNLMHLQCLLCSSNISLCKQENILIAEGNQKPCTCPDWCGSVD